MSTKSTSGRRTKKSNCDIYDLIDGLDDSENLKDLIKRLKVILNDLAYALVTGESAANASHEEWHETFTDHLYVAAGQDRAAATRAAASSSVAVAAPSSAEVPRVSRGNGKMPKRPVPGNLPRSLQEIFTGTHTSLHESDDDHALDDDDD